MSHGYTESEVIDENGDMIIIKNQSRDFVVCNLSSVVLGNVDVKNDEELWICCRNSN